MSRNAPLLETDATPIVDRIVSGGQTGVDRAALDAAIACQIPHGGWCPKGRIAEDGRIPARYELQEMESIEYSHRTRQNILDSDGTLILSIGRLGGGTLLTLRLAKELQKPILLVELTRASSKSMQLRERKRLHQWLQEHAIRTLNIASPRGSKFPDVYQRSYDFLIGALRR